MALHWDISKVHDYQSLHNTGPNAHPKGSPEDIAGDREWEITNHLIWMTLGIGMNGITEKNVERFYTRYVALHVMDGQDVPEWATFDVFRRRIGLTTNATAETDLQFGKGLAKRIMDRAERRAKRLMADAAQEVTA